jgi:hypothetical protein
LITNEGFTGFAVQVKDKVPKVEHFTTFYSKHF